MLQNDFNRKAVEMRAIQSQGISNEAIYNMVRGVLTKRGVRGGILVDVGCGTGNLYRFVEDFCEKYIGVDVVRYEKFPTSADFCQVNLDCEKIPLPDNTATVVVAIETIEHLENPRAFMRELVRLTKPGGWVIVTTPNQLSFLSLLTLVVKHRFSAFQDVHYPTHITALLEIDLLRIARKCGLIELAIHYTSQGRIVLTPWHYPKFFSKLLPRALSDNLLLIGKKNE